MMSNNLGPGTIEWQGTQYRTILSTEATGGAISIVDSVSPPQSGPPRHIHHDADETFVMLTGEAEFWLDGETRMLQAGESLFVPRGKEHTFRVAGNLPSRHLVILTPGGFEGFFSEMASRECAIPEDMEVIETVAQIYQLSFTGPPLGAEPQHSAVTEAAL